MYVAGGEHPNRRPALDFLQQARSRKIQACTSTEVLQEILYRYSSLGRRELARTVYDLFVEVCPVILGVSLADTDRARDLVCAGTVISVRDSFHAAVMINHGIEWIATFDAGFDRIEGIRRFNLTATS
jgi:predicted nucleic acid-binding protein